ncbi:MAG: sensor histidine kinase [Aristaeellaceae bacterium]
MRKRWQQFRNARLSTKLTLIFLIGVVIPFEVISIQAMLGIAVRSQQALLDTARLSYEQAGSYLEYRYRDAWQTAATLIGDDSLRRGFQRSPDSMSTSEQVTLYDTVLDRIETIASIQNLKRIRFYVDDGFIFSSVAERFGPVSALPEALRRSADSKGTSRLNWVLQAENASLTAAAGITSPDDLLINTAYLVVEMDLSAISTLLERSNVADGQITVLLTEEGLLASSDAETPGWICEELQLFIQRQQTSFAMCDTPHGRWYMSLQRIPYSNAYLLSLLPRSASWKSAVSTLTFMIVSLLAVSLLTCFTYNWLASDIAGRIDRLNRSFDEVGQGRYLPVERIDCMDEIGELTVNYNGMAEELEHLMQEQFRLGKKISQAELMALQSQINPHFLYNTLDMIKWMAQGGQLEDVTETVENLTAYYRLTLNRGKSVISIGDELRMCAVYVSIQQKRFGDSFAFEVEVDDALRSCAIPKITLQPLVENAIVHGIRERKAAGGLIRITGTLREGRILLTVKDNGIGMTMGGIPSKTGSGYGMRNIQQRLRLFFDTHDVMTLHSIKGIGTTVTLSIPAWQTDAEETLRRAEALDGQYPAGMEDEKP